MNVELVIVGILIVFLIAQQAFWSVVVFKLTNRIMSRDFSEFKRANAPQKLSPLPQDASDTIDEQLATDANKFFGIA